MGGVLALRDIKTIVILKILLLSLIKEDDEKIDPEKFWEMVEEKKGGHNHTTYCVKELPDDFYKFKNWLDNKGNSFSEGEFS